MSSLRIIVVVFFLMLGLAACTTSQSAPTSLYDDLGGQSGTAQLVDAFINRLAEDPLVVDTFVDTDMDQFRSHLIDQICAIGDGGCEYTGRTMRSAHEGLDIQPRQFNAMVEDLMQAMDDVTLSQGTQNRLLKRLAPMYQDMVH